MILPATKVVTIGIIIREYITILRSVYHFNGLEINMRLLLFLIPVIAIFTGCLTDDDNVLPPVIIGDLLILESDFTSGNFGNLDASDEYISRFSIYDDASIFSYKGRTYILEQYGTDNIVKLNAEGTGVEYQIHLIDNANPHGIGFISDTKAYVVCNKYSQILIVNPANGGITDSIDVSSYAYRDSSNTTNNIPNAENVIIDGDYAYVSLQRRNGLSPGGATWVLKIDCSANAVVDTFKCNFPNSSKMILVDNALYLANKGKYNVMTDGGVEKIDLATGTVSTVVRETVNGWNIVDLAYIGNNKAVAPCANYNADYSEKTLLSAVLDLTTGLFVDTLSEVVEIGCAIYDENNAKLYVAERDTSGAGVCIYENGVYKTKVTTTLSPNRFAFLED